jgi:hypothetical protein
MKLHFASLAAALVATACGGSAFAQPAAPAPSIPRYQVEIIVFAHRDFDVGEERFPQELTPLRADQGDPSLGVPTFEESGPPSADAVIALEPETAPATTPPAEDPLAVRVLAPEELQLNTEYRKLTNLAAYRPLLHAGWVQPGLPEDQAKPVDLMSLGVVNPRGNVRVYLSRFLHVSLDLSYQDGAASNAAAAPPGNELREIAIAPRYRLVTERQTRSGELHYFDHPAFGVLVKITPVPTGNTGSTGRRPAA